MTGVHETLFPHPRGEQLVLEEERHPLDVEQEFEPVTSYEVRDAMEQLVRRDLLGPWDGDDEQLAPGAPGPRERYLVGMLGPKHAPESAIKEAERLVDTELAVEGDGEAELPEVVTPQTLGRIWASSMGLSCAVKQDVDALQVSITWGRYQPESAQDADGRPRAAWRREPVSVERKVRLDGAPTARIPLDDVPRDQPGVRLAVDVRPRDGHRVVQLVLVNEQQEPSSNADTAWLFQSRIVVTALDGASAVFSPIDDPADVGGGGQEPEEAHLRLLYRHHRRYATGHNVAVHPHVRPDQHRCAWKLETTWLPAYDVPATAAAGSGAELSMDALATAGAAGLEAALAPLVQGYERWLGEQEGGVAGLPAELQDTARHALATARTAAQRIRAGIDLLTTPHAPGHDDALRAFRFANRVMADQRRHTALGLLRRSDGLSYRDALARVEAPQNAMWRPFQLAFVLLNLPSITDPTHPERAADPDALVDLLFFPTGGGKTEAYLGLTAYTFAIRRLQGTVGTGVDARSGTDGVAVLMRYTLRLLTAQQFQRAAALVCAAEVARRDDEATWGTTPFRIGLWVGGGVSPNWWDVADEQIAEAKEAGRGQRVNVLQTLSCPWCGTALSGHRDLVSDGTARRVVLYCPNGEGAHACPFSKRSSPREGLPVLTVDEEIYRYTPALVIATVDKLAQLPWRGFAGMLFGRVQRRCPRHGYRHDDLDSRVECADKHRAKGPWPAVTTQPVVRLRPPDLIIQDELHLISGALGTTVGLFEAAVDELCTWRLPGGTESAPKIVASTATTKRASEQVRGVFGRRLAIFPPPVLDIADTYFSQQVPVTPEQPGRRYLGVCAHGVRLKAAEIRLAEILLIAGQTLFDRHGEPADPYLTLVGYFNATRELAGMRRYLDDDVATRVRRHGRRKGLSDRIVSRTGMLTISELTSRISSADISQALTALEVGFDPRFDTSARKRALRADLAESHKEGRPAHPVSELLRARRDNPVDVVLATSMLQVGVDVSRFGLMVVTGQPKNTAEYIQASSRVGRDAARPGLVVTLFNWARPRDLAHYEDFEHYHATFYRQVEALSVTPFTRRSLDRGTAATLVAAFRNADETHSRNRDAQGAPLAGPVVARVVERLLRRAETVAGPRGRDYLEERIKVFTDVWQQLRTAGDVPLGYEQAKGVRGLLRRAGDGRWDERTVGSSLRETENEVNLLVPADLTTPTFGEPTWSFAAPGAGEEPDDAQPVGDELGDTALPAGAAR